MSADQLANDIAAIAAALEQPRWRIWRDVIDRTGNTTQRIFRASIAVDSKGVPCAKTGPNTSPVNDTP